MGKVWIGKNQQERNLSEEIKMPKYRSKELIKNPIRREELEQIIEIAKPRDKFYLAFLWLTGARINEIAKRLRKSAGRIEDNFLIFTIEIEKKQKGEPSIRDVPIPLSDPLAQIVLERWKNLKEDDFMIKVSARRVRQILEKYMVRGQSISPHLLRHSRATYLKRVKGFDDLDLMKFFGWKDVRSPYRYAFVGYKDIARKLIS